MRKLMALTLACTLLISLIAGCTAATATPAVTTATTKPATTTAPTTAAATTAATTAVPKPVSMRFMWWGSQVRHDATISVIGLYEKKNPNVKIAYEFMGQTDYFPKLTTLSAAKDVPDVFQIGNNFRSYPGIFEPLDAYFANKSIDMSDTSEPFIAPTRIDGKILGVCLGTNALCLLYDPAMFTAAGVALPTDKWTWADFEKAAVTISQKLGIFGTGAQDRFYGLFHYIQQSGKDLAMYDPSLKKLGYTDDKIAVDYFTMFKRLMDVKGVYPTTDVIAAIKDIQGDPFVQKKAAMMWSFSNQLVAVTKAAGRPVGITPYPKITADGLSGMAIRASQSIAMSANTPNKAAAAAFMSYFVNDIEANRVLNAERGVPIMAKIRADLASTADPVTKLVFDYIGLIGKIASHPQGGEPPGQLEIADGIGRIWEQIALGKTTPAQAAADFRKLATDVMNK